MTMACRRHGARGTHAKRSSLLLDDTTWKLTNPIPTIPSPEGRHRLDPFFLCLVIERFQCNESSVHADGTGSEAGKDFVTHQASFNWFFAMRSDKLLPLMSDLNDDLAAQLSLNGAHILSRSGVTRTGFHYDYRLGKSIGSVTISPISVDSGIHRAMPLPKCIVDVSTKVELTEKWYLKEQTAMQASLNNSMP
jgi:hypothetical protein